MKINELVQVGTRTEEYEEKIPATYDNEGKEITPETVEIRTREIPIMESVTRDMTPEEEAACEEPPYVEIEMLKEQLAQTDYKAIKYAEGWISEAEYAPIREERQAIRDRINELEKR